jgi:hypothetical protein
MAEGRKLEDAQAARVTEEIAQQAVADAEEEEEGSRSRSSSFGFKDLEKQLKAPRGSPVNKTNPQSTLRKTGRDLTKGGSRKRTLKKRRGLNKRKNVRGSRRR